MIVKALTKYDRINGRKIYGMGAVTLDGRRYGYYIGLAFGGNFYTFDTEGELWSSDKKKAFELVPGPDRLYQIEP